VATLSDPIKIDAGQKVEFSLDYEYDELKKIICTKVTGVTISAFANADGTGTDISASIDETLYPSKNNVRIEAVNRGLTNGYITAFTITGEPMAEIDARWAYESTATFHNATFELDNPWLTITAVGTTDYISETSTTLDDRARINTVGNTLISYLSTAKPYPVIQMQGRYATQFSLELEDKITLTSGTLGINDDFRISKIAHKSMTSTQDIQTTMWLYPVLTPVEST